MTGTADGAAKRKRCACGKFEHKGSCDREHCACGLFVHNGPCPKRGVAPSTPEALIERGRRVEPNGCHSYRGRRDKYPLVQRQRISRRLLGLTPSDPRWALHTCDNDWCINIRHLYIGTIKDNANDAVTRGTVARGERVAGSKLTEEDVMTIRSDTRTQREIAADYGIAQPEVSRIKNGKRWGWL